MNYVEVVIEGDVNDGDYVKKTTYMNLEDFNNFGAEILSKYFSAFAGQEDYTDEMYQLGKLAETDDKYKEFYDEPYMEFEGKKQTVKDLFRRIFSIPSFNGQSSHTIWLDNIKGYDENGDKFEVILSNPYKELLEGGQK